jgi:hypothetical protein
MRAMIASIGLVTMLIALYRILVWSVDASDRSSLRRYATNFIVGSLHFSFTLSLLVMPNDRMAPPIERQRDALCRWRTADRNSCSRCRTDARRLAGRSRPLRCASWSAWRISLLVVLGAPLWTHSADGRHNPHALRGGVRSPAHQERSRADDLPQGIDRIPEPTTGGSRHGTGASRSSTIPG